MMPMPRRARDTDAPIWASGEVSVGRCSAPMFWANDEVLQVHGPRMTGPM